MDVLSRKKNGTSCFQGCAVVSLEKQVVPDVERPWWHKHGAAESRQRARSLWVPTVIAGESWGVLSSVHFYNPILGSPEPSKLLNIEATRTFVGCLQCRYYVELWGYKDAKPCPSWKECPGPWSFPDPAGAVQPGVMMGRDHVHHLGYFSNYTSIALWPWTGHLISLSLDFLLLAA